MAIVTTTYRYKPPPKRKGRKLAEITGPAIVSPKKGRHLGEAAAEVGVGPPGVGPADSSKHSASGQRLSHPSQR